MTKNDKKLAALAQGLYLTNITILPGVSFIILILLYVKNKAELHPAALTHFRQAILANLVAGLLLLGVSAIILIAGSISSPYTWMYFLIYFLSIHSALILFGVFAFIKALAKETYIYPGFGSWWK